MATSCVRFLHESEMHAGNAATLAMKAQAMRARSNHSPADSAPDRSPAKAPYDEPQNDPATDIETELEPDEDDDSELDDPEQEDDDRWDVFLLDDNGELIPERSDFWIPD